MPYLITENGASEYFDYDPDVIAEHLFNHRKVTPDEGLTPEELEQHQLEIQGSLRRLWGDQQTRPYTDRITRPERPPDAYRPPTGNDYLDAEGIDFLNVEPSPMQDYPIREVDPYARPISQTAFFRNRVKRSIG